MPSSIAFRRSRRRSMPLLTGNTTSPKAARAQLVVVTGGSSGIGKEIARLFLLQGATVVIVADQPEKLHNAERELRAVSDRVASVVCDIGDAASVSAMGIHVLTRYGCPDVIVNNAGFATYRTFEQTSAEEMERLATVNFLGHLRCTKAFLPG